MWPHTQALWTHSNDRETNSCNTLPAPCTLTLNDASTLDLLIIIIIKINNYLIANFSVLSALYPCPVSTTENDPFFT